MVEEAAQASVPASAGGLGRGKSRAIEFVPLSGSAEGLPRRLSGIAEFDRTTGGGLVPGGCTLIGGDPGIGKSTLLLQAAAALARAGRRVLYISGEEAIEQIRLRARRLNLHAQTLELAATINLRDKIGRASCRERV